MLDRTWALVAALGNLSVRSIMATTVGDRKII